MSVAFSAKSAPLTKYESAAEPNVVPFIDILLVLLIIFMVAAPMSTIDVNVDFPPPSRTPNAAAPLPTILVYQADGAFYLDGQLVPEAELHDRLRATILRNNPDSPNYFLEQVFLRADQSADYGDVIAVIDLLQEQGFNKVGIVSQSVAD